MAATRWMGWALALALTGCGPAPEEEEEEVQEGPPAPDTCSTREDALSLASCQPGAQLLELRAGCFPLALGLLEGRADLRQLRGSGGELSGRFSLRVRQAGLKRVELAFAFGEESSATPWAERWERAVSRVVPSRSSEKAAESWPSNGASIVRPIASGVTARPTSIGPASESACSPPS